MAGPNRRAYDGLMSAILYPVAGSAAAALQAPVGFAARQREARQAAGGAQVAFVSETYGPSYAKREAAQSALGEILAKGAGWTTLLPVLPTPNGRPARLAVQKPAFKDGRRWPGPDPSLAGATQWRLSVSYWRILPAVAEGAAEPASPTTAARKLRRSAAGEVLAAAEVKALAEQPLRAVRPQQPLDLGLFEVRPPEAPHIAMPDE